MKKFSLLFIFLCCLVMSCSSCSSKFDRTKTDDIYAQIVLSDNRKINLELYYDKAPVTVDNFIDLVEQKFYNNTIFHRVIEDFMIQGGGYVMEGGTLKSKGETTQIKGEFSQNGYKKNTIKHVAGVISMARADGYDTASSQFFICSATVPYLDGKHAAFGKTTDANSKQVVVNISKVQTYQYSNSFQDMPLNVIKIKTIKLSNSKF